MGKKNPLVFLDVSIDGDPAERMVFELFYDAAPRTAENFRALCTGEKGNSPSVGRPLHYKGSFFHRIVKGLIAQGGDFLKRDGSFGESIYGDKFPDEPISKLKHNERGLLTMAVADRDVRGSLFGITLKPFRQLDSKHVVFGKLVEGLEVLENIDNAGDENGWPLVAVKIVNCGEFFQEKKRELKRGKDGSSNPNIHEANCKGKRKKSSAHKRRRRKYYESETSFDSETETSDSDSDTDSESSSLSSSSDDRRRKRKRSSKRDRYKRGKKSKRHEKKHRKRHRKSKRRSKRESDSESSEAGDADINGKNKNHKPLPEMIAQNQQSIADEPASVLPGKGTVTDIVEKEVEHIKQNGVRQSNGEDLEAKAGAASHRPDKFDDDHRGKTRSQSVSPKRSLSKSMSISHEKSLSPRQSARSPSFNKSPQLPSRRSRSISETPASNISRSPVTNKKEKSISRSPMRDVKKSLSRSPVKFSLVGGRRGSGRPPPRKISRSPVGAFARRSYSRSPISERGRSPVSEGRRNLISDRGRSPIADRGKSPISDHRRSPVSDRGRNLVSNHGRSPPLSDHGRSPGSDRGRSPGSDRGRSLSKSPNDGSPQQRIRRGRGFSQRFSYARRYRTPSPDRSPVRSYRYGRNERYRRSPRYNRSPPRERIPLRKSPQRYRSSPTDRSPRRSPRRLRSPRREKSPVRYRSRKSRTRSPVSRSPSPYPAKRPSPPSRSRSPLTTRSSPGLTSPKKANNKNRSRSSSSSSPSPLGNNKRSLVSYGDGSPDVN